ncbi:hypothetical protein [Corallococcus sp. AB045]|uniref:hypothetical protein n=1 Tax=Corallococcus sp. AB045 TaxID=2316719 RepID=UPI0011C37519|nr:hypothetical protein [Corallococcus sp. AB045]
MAQKLTRPEEEKKEIVAAAGSGKITARSWALAEIEKDVPGTEARLKRLYTAYSRQSLFLWQMPALAIFETPVGLLQAVGEAVRRSTGNDFNEAQLSEDWVRVDQVSDNLGVHEDVIAEEDEDDSVEDSSLPPPRVVRVRVGTEMLGLGVRLTKRQYFIREDNERSVDWTQDINLSLDLAQPGSRALVFGGWQESRKAVRTVVEWLTNAEVPRRNPALKRYIEPFHFDESHVLALEADLGLEFVGFRGDDAQDVAGKIAMEGKLAGFKMAPLDLSDERIKSQVGIPQDIRIYNWDYQHPDDGFVEGTIVAFFTGPTTQHSHISFLRKTSQAAMADVVNALSAVVRPAV